MSSAKATVQHVGGGPCYGAGAVCARDHRVAKQDWPDGLAGRQRYAQDATGESDRQGKIAGPRVLLFAKCVATPFTAVIRSVVFRVLGSAHVAIAL